MNSFAQILSYDLCAASFSLGVYIQTAQAQLKTITPEKAAMMGNVENFFIQNFRDVTMRKSLEWGDVQIDGKGKRTIRYEALIMGQRKNH